MNPKATNPGDPPNGWPASPPYAATTPARKWLVAVLVILSISAVTLVGVGTWLVVDARRAPANESPSVFTTFATSPTPDVKVQLIATGRGKIVVNFSTPDGTSQRDSAGTVVYTYTPVPWKPSAVASVYVQNMGGTGEVGCVIKVNGEVVAEQASTGHYAIAICQL